MKTLRTLKENAFFIVGILLVIVGTTALAGGFKYAKKNQEDVRPIVDRVVEASVGMKVQDGEGEAIIKLSPEERGSLLSRPAYSLLRFPAIVFQLITYLGVLAIVFGCSRAAAGKRSD